MQSLSRKNEGIKYLLCVIHLFSKYAFVVPLGDKTGISIVNAFDKILKQSNRSECNGTRTHNHLVRKRTLNHLAKLAK